MWLRMEKSLNTHELDDLILCSQSRWHLIIIKIDKKFRKIIEDFYSFIDAFAWRFYLFLYSKQITYAALFVPNKNETPKEKDWILCFFLAFHFSNRNYRIIIGNHFDIIEKGTLAAAAFLVVLFIQIFMMVQQGDWRYFSFKENLQSHPNGSSCIFLTMKNSNINGKITSFDTTLKRSRTLNEKRCIVSLLGAIFVSIAITNYIDNWKTDSVTLFNRWVLFSVFPFLFASIKSSMMKLRDQLIITMIKWME